MLFQILTQVFMLKVNTFFQTAKKQKIKQENGLKKENGEEDTTCISKASQECKQKKHLWWEDFRGMKSSGSWYWHGSMKKQDPKTFWALLSYWTGPISRWTGPLYPSLPPCLPYKLSLHTSAAKTTTKKASK